MKSGTTVITPDGDLRVIDPSPSVFPYLKRLNPEFEIASDPPPKEYVTRLQTLRGVHLPGLGREEFAGMDGRMAWALHNSVMNGRITLHEKGEVSVLDLKTELGNRILGCCDLCGFKCKVNRHEKAGKCGAGEHAYVNDHFEHISEGKPITPALNVVVSSCPLRCVFCQAPENYSPSPDSSRLTGALWKTITGAGETARTIEFVGGEPMASGPQIVGFLAAAPDDFALPVVMNCNLYLGSTGIELMNGVVDVWLADMNFGNDECAKRLSGAERFWAAATESLSLMVAQDAKVIVRVLVLPGHNKCCHLKALDWLAQYRDLVWVSVMDQFLPLHESHRHQDINRLPSDKEIQEVRAYARRVGLRDVNDAAEGSFWG
ncbi:MAG: hypothetical protein AB1512_02920 [Thermodesulfobacteriota bacterium]